MEDMLGLPWWLAGRVGEGWNCDGWKGFVEADVGGLESLNGATVIVFETAVLTIWGAGAGSCSGLVGRGSGSVLGNSNMVPLIVIHAGVQAGVNSSCMGLKRVVACVGLRWWH